jgi:protein-disulfide isomerase
MLALLAAASPLAAQTGLGMQNGYCVGGQPSAPIRIEVFSDYQCPACRAFFLETLRPLLRDYARENKVCLVYHDFPLQMHNYARVAARYAVAARRLGLEQWERVSAALYTDQLQWAEDGKIEPVVARALPPDDMAKVKKLLEDPSINQTIDQEVALAAQRQIRSTPTFFLYANGREQRVEGSISYLILKDYLDRLLK